MTQPSSPQDIALTAMSREVLASVKRCAEELGRRLGGNKIYCDFRRRQTPRGMSTFLSVAGKQGLLLIVDFTLIDGLTVSGQLGAVLDVRLLDACGDVAAACSPQSAPYRTSAEDVVEAAGGGLSATALHILAMGHFDVVH